MVLTCSILNRHLFIEWEWFYFTGNNDLLNKWKVYTYLITGIIFTYRISETVLTHKISKILYSFNKGNSALIE